jgi:formylglycine-generating enzyme required for sulfatase activity
MVYVPGGAFWMGSGDDDPNAWVDEEPRREVFLYAFWIDRTEVTNAQYAAFLQDQGNQVEGYQPWLDVEAGDCLIEQAGDAFRPKAGYEDHPVIRVTWYGAHAYCEWAGKRLPTEAEWEKAARGPDGRIYPWGDEFDGTRLNFCDTNCPRDSRQEAWDDGFAETAPVGSYPDGASPYGALDMAGNAWEWVADLYREIRHDARVIRGGGWESAPQSARAAARYNGFQATGYSYVGFRCVQSRP